MSSFTGMKVSLGGAKRPPNQYSERSVAVLHDDSDSDVERVPKEVALTGFDEKPAVSSDRPAEKPLLVIPRLENEDWREQVRKRRRQSETKQGKNLLPAEVQRQRDAEAQGLIGEEGKAEKPTLQYGLQVTAKEDKGKKICGDAPAEEVAQGEKLSQAEEPPKPKTDDELALDALLGRSSAPKKDLIIEQDKKNSNSDPDPTTTFPPITETSTSVKSLRHPTPPPDLSGKAGEREKYEGNCMW